MEDPPAARRRVQAGKHRAIRLVSKYLATQHIQCWHLVSICSYVHIITPQIRVPKRKAWHSENCPIGEATSYLQQRHGPDPAFTYTHGTGLNTYKAGEVGGGQQIGRASTYMQVGTKSLLLRRQVPRESCLHLCTTYYMNIGSFTHSEGKKGAIGRSKIDMGRSIRWARRWGWGPSYTPASLQIR